MRAGGVDEQVEQFRARLVLHRCIVAADPPEVGGVGDQVGPLIAWSGPRRCPNVAGDGVAAFRPTISISRTFHPSETRGWDHVCGGAAVGGEGCATPGYVPWLRQVVPSDGARGCVPAPCRP